jgi:hypothetical protein
VIFAGLVGGFLLVLVGWMPSRISHQYVKSLDFMGLMVGGTSVSLCFVHLGIG